MRVVKELFKGIRSAFAVNIERCIAVSGKCQRKKIAPCSAETELFEETLNQFVNINYICIIAPYIDSVISAVNHVRKVFLNELDNSWENGFNEHIDHITRENLVKENVHDKVINCDNAVTVSVGDILSLSETEEVNKLRRGAEAVNGVYNLLNGFVIDINIVVVLVFVSCNIVGRCFAFCVVCFSVVIIGCLLIVCENSFSELVDFLTNLVKHEEFDNSLFLFAL